MQNMLHVKLEVGFLSDLLILKLHNYYHLYPPSSSSEGTPYFSSWSSDRGVIHFSITSEVIVSTGISSGSILLMRVWNLL